MPIDLSLQESSIPPQQMDAAANGVKNGKSSTSLEINRQPKPSSASLSPTQQHRQLTLRKYDSTPFSEDTVVNGFPENAVVKGPPQQQGKPQVYLFGNDLTHYSPNQQFGFCICGVFTFNVLYGYLQELLAIHIAGRKFGIFLACCQFAGYAFWAHFLAKLNRTAIKQKQPSLRVPAGKFVGLSLLRAFDLAVTNSAMQYLNYPAKTLIKSCRVVFTMVIGVLIRNKRYMIRDYAAVCMLVVGLVIFLHADSTTDAVFHPKGVLLLLVSLTCDGTLNNWSEQMMEEYQLTQDEFHSKLYVVSLIASLFAAHMHNELFEGIQHFLLQPGTVPEIESGANLDDTIWTVQRKAIVLLVFGTTGIMGASCLGAITKRFGALSMALTSTARKATTLFLSFAFFNNTCTSEHVVGVSLFLSGLIMKTLNKQRTPVLTTGEQSEGRRKAPSRLGKCKDFFAGVLVRIPFIGRSRSYGQIDHLLRRRSSVDMELGVEGTSD